GGPDDWRALFHEAGHTEHFAHTSPSLSVEERRLGDNAVTEGWAMLLEHLTIDPVWLERRLDFPRPREFSAEGATQLLWVLRRYCAKLIYELEFHTEPDVTAMRRRYVELLGDALKVEPSDTDYLADIDDGFYSSGYLRAWAFEAQLRAYLREKFGNEWFTRKDAGSLVRDLWSEGQKPTADELLREVTGAKLELEAAADRVREEGAVVELDGDLLLRDAGQVERVDELALGLPDIGRRDPALGRAPVALEQAVHHAAHLVLQRGELTEGRPANQRCHGSCLLGSIC